MELPIIFTEYTNSLFGNERFDIFRAALSGPPIVSVRINMDKGAAPMSDECVPWSPLGYYLRKRPVFTIDPLFHAGLYYVQEASSMFLHLVLSQYVHSPIKMLDLCAAPGGKSTHAISLLPKGSLLVCNEPNASRAQILAENIIKWGNPSVVVTRNEPSEFAAVNEQFDLIIVDAPCSGEGMFRKDLQAVEHWSPANVENCVDRQRKILAQIWPSLAPGGLLVYSTCTFNSKENEENVGWICSELGAETLPIAIEEEWGVTSSLTTDKMYAYRFIPGYTRGEGFFLSLLRKEDGEESSRKNISLSPSKRLPANCEKVARWLQKSDDFYIFQDEYNIKAYPIEYSAFINKLNSKLRVIHAGISLATIKGDKLIPHHTLAMSTAIDREKFPIIELTLEQALSYLHRESLSLDGAPKGYALVTYKGSILGFINSLGNRANNLYPQEWRIRKDPRVLLL